MKPIRKLPAIFYCSGSGQEPVREWLKSLNSADRKTIGEDIAYVQYKWPLGKPRVDHLRVCLGSAQPHWKSNRPCLVCSESFSNDFAAWICQENSTNTAFRFGIGH